MTYILGDIRLKHYKTNNFFSFDTFLNNVSKIVFVSRNVNRWKRHKRNFTAELIKIETIMKKINYLNKYFDIFSNLIQLNNGTVVYVQVTFCFFFLPNN